MEFSHFAESDFDEAYKANCWYLLKALIHVHSKGFFHGFLTKLIHILVDGSFIHAE
jgi:hypothetical protein